MVNFARQKTSRKWHISTSCAQNPPNSKRRTEIEGLLLFRNNIQYASQFRDQQQRDETKKFIDSVSNLVKQKIESIIEQYKKHDGMELKIHLFMPVLLNPVSIHDEEEWGNKAVNEVFVNAPMLYSPVSVDTSQKSGSPLYDTDFYDAEE